MQSTAELIIRFIFGLLALLFWFRFLLQATDADRFNPISQAATESETRTIRPAGQK
ncbi:MAG: hypothetical protein RIC89_07270 [Pseudomonadales bacterium]